VSPFPFLRGRGSVNKRGGEAPSLKLFPPLLFEERGIKGVRLIRLEGYTSCNDDKSIVTKQNLLLD
jgi:hypothetical protein